MHSGRLKVPLSYEQKICQYSPGFLSSYQEDSFYPEGIAIARGYDFRGMRTAGETLIAPNLEHRQVFIETQYGLFAVDEGIASAICHLHELNLRTLFSCQGAGSQGIAYITFLDKPPQALLRKNTKIGSYHYTRCSNGVLTTTLKSTYEPWQQKRFLDMLTSW
jgi:hypothetical protein